MISSMAKKEVEEPGGGKKTEKGRRWGRDGGDLHHYVNKKGLRRRVTSRI